jgi:hypothetical protein
MPTRGYADWADKADGADRSRQRRSPLARPGTDVTGTPTSEGTSLPVGFAPRSRSLRTRASRPTSDPPDPFTAVGPHPRKPSQPRLRSRQSRLPRTDYEIAVRERGSVPSRAAMVIPALGIGEAVRCDERSALKRGRRAPPLSRVQACTRRRRSLPRCTRDPDSSQGGVPTPVGPGSGHLCRRNPVIRPIPPRPVRRESSRAGQQHERPLITEDGCLI